MKNSQRLLYEQDLVAWCDDTVRKLKAGNFQEIDIDRLIEEIAGLAGRDRRELKATSESCWRICSSGSMWNRRTAIEVGKSRFENNGNSYVIYLNNRLVYAMT